MEQSLPPASKEAKTFCIILCVSDALDFFDAQIKSLAQYDHEVFLIVSLDCSNSASELRAREIVRKYFNEEESRFIQGPRKGFLENFMFASRFALTLKDYDFYAFSDQDDIWKDTKLSRAEKLLSADSPLPELYSSSTLLIDSDDKPLRMHKDTPIKTFAMSLVENVSPGNAMIFNLPALKIFTKTSEYGILYHEWWLFILTIERGKVFFDPEPQVYYRQHTSNTIGAGGSLAKKVLSSFNRTRYYDSISRNVEALLGNDLKLSQESAKILSHFRYIFSYNPLQRVYGLLRSGVKRRSWGNTIFFYLLVLLAPGLKEIRKRFNPFARKQERMMHDPKD